MSTSAGKVLVEGVIELFGKDLFVLEFLLARQPERVERPASDSWAGWFFLRQTPASTRTDPFCPVQSSDSTC